MTYIYSKSAQHAKLRKLLRSHWFNPKEMILRLNTNSFFDTFRNCIMNMNSLDEIRPILSI